jgi:hypothetical protein
MVFNICIELMLHYKIHPTGQQQIIESGEQLQTMRVSEPGRLQAEIDIRAQLIPPDGA